MGVPGAGGMVTLLGAEEMTVAVRKMLPIELQVEDKQVRILGGQCQRE